MPYGETQRLVTDKDDMVLVESAFKETTRSGSPKSSVLLALTNKKLLIVSRKLVLPKPRVYYNELESELSLSEIDLTVFKQTRRQVLKARFCNKTVKYYELGNFKKRKIFWDIWCNHIKELNKGPRLWPFRTTRKAVRTVVTTPTPSTSGTDSSCEIPQPEDRYRWTDKNLFLGSKRELENSIQPVPVTGITQTTLKELMSEIVGDYKQSNHCWLMSDHDLHDFQPDNQLCTYTGEPTSNVTYVSILTIMREAEDTSSRM